MYLIDCRTMLNVKPEMRKVCIIRKNQKILKREKITVLKVNTLQDGIQIQKMKKAGIFFGKGYEEIEALTVVDLLRRAGFDVKTISITDNNVVILNVGDEVTINYKTQEGKIIPAKSIK